jgi:hypothetical protein
MMYAAVTLLASPVMLAVLAAMIALPAIAIAEFKL